MTPKQRMVGLLGGEEIDLVPLVQYHDMNAPNQEIWDALGPDSMGVLEWVKAYRIQTPNCHSECTDLKKGRLQGWRETLSTPKGKLQQIKLYVPELDGVAGFGEHYVKKTEDYEVLLSYLEDVEVVQDLSEIEDFHRRIGDGGIPHVSLPRTP